MSEGNVYLCRWERSDEDFRVWIAKRPSLSATGWTLQDALDELSGVVCLATGDGEAVFELDPPAGGGARLDHYVSLSGNSNWRPPKGFSLDNFDTLYEGGVCRTCCTGIGPRSNVPMPVAVLGTADLLHSSPRMPAVKLASGKFRSRLTPAEQDCVEWVPVEFRGKARRQFFELRSRRPIKTVEDKAKPVSGWRCPDCKHACFSVDYEHEYIAAVDLAKHRAPLIMIDDSHGIGPAVPYGRWLQLRGGAGTRNLTSSEVVTLPSARVRRRPVLRMLDKSGSQAIHREFSYWSSMDL